MEYGEILKRLADRENCSVEQIEEEMNTAIKTAGLDCCAQDFLEIVVWELLVRTIYSKWYNISSITSNRNYKIFLLGVI